MSICLDLRVEAGLAEEPLSTTLDLAVDTIEELLDISFVLFAKAYKGYRHDSTCSYVNEPKGANTAICDCECGKLFARLTEIRTLSCQEVK